MQELLEEAIVRKARAVLRVQRIELATQRQHADRYQKRTGLLSGTPTHTHPSWWSVHPHFSPEYCIKHARYLSRTIWRRLQDGVYEPTPAVKFDIPKPDGSNRTIMAFTIPDSALANVLHRNITKRNINLLSSYSFAYRQDKSVFDAILNLARSLSGPKSYVVQYDFSKYFDTISHSYLKKMLFEKRSFIITSAEREAIGKFLEHSYATVADYSAGLFDVRTAGVPQGSSLSLFLSNAAAHELDLALEKRNGTFVRFADDVVAITHSYTDALGIADQFRTHCKDAGLKINFGKSPGILLFGGGPERERRDFVIDTDDGVDIETVHGVDYLGHRVSPEGISLPRRSIKRIKQRISSIIHKHLFLYRRGDFGALNAERIGSGFRDWDLVTCINEIRKYIYGGLRESQIEGFLGNQDRLPFVRGLMAFFPLTTSGRQVGELDGWLLNILKRAQRERVRVINSFDVDLDILSKDELLSGSWYNYPAVNQDMTLPSFSRAWRASRKYYLRYGLNSIRPPSYYSLISY